MYKGSYYRGVQLWERLPVEIQRGTKSKRYKYKVPVVGRNVKLKDTIEVKS